MRPFACSDRELGSQQSTKAILLLSCTADNPSCKGKNEGGMKAPLALLVKLDLQYANMRVLEHKTRFHTGHSSVKKSPFTWRYCLKQKWKTSGKNWLWNDCTISFRACYRLSAIWFSLQKTKVTSINTQQHYPTSIHTEQWPIICAGITSTSQWAGQCILYRNSSLMVAQRFLSPSDPNSKTFHMQILLSKQLFGLIDTTDTCIWKLWHICTIVHPSGTQTCSTQ